MLKYYLRTAKLTPFGPNETEQIVLIKGQPEGMIIEGATHCPGPIKVQIVTDKSQFVTKDNIKWCDRYSETPRDIQKMGSRWDGPNI